jgi:2-amino-4-hydroxy-6-hydroxymethyldihydropteridine diphosphokinase
LTRAFLGLGSNIDDRLDALSAAVRALDGDPQISFLRSSRVYRTQPVGGPDQPGFLNAVIEVGTTLDPHSLLVACLSTEEALGRVRQERWGPRTIDIDLLQIERMVLDEPGLIVPHPRLHLRAFALLPLLELEPDPVLPGGLPLPDARPEGEISPCLPPLGIGG